jgi:hypothetical protein
VKLTTVFWLVVFVVFGGPSARYALALLIRHWQATLARDWVMGNRSHLRRNIKTESSFGQLKFFTSLPCLLPAS